jgi:plasmid stabilization system protein ParE
VDYKIIVAPRAISDLRDIVLYISPDRPDAARRLGYALIEKTKALAAFPRSGGVVREFADDKIRQLVLPPYRIIYRIDDAARVVGVARFWHGAQSNLSSLDLQDRA